MPGTEEHSGNEGCRNPTQCAAQPRGKRSPAAEPLSLGFSKLITVQPREQLLLELVENLQTMNAWNTATVLCNLLCIWYVCVSVCMCERMLVCVCYSMEVGGQPIAWVSPHLLPC